MLVFTRRVGEAIVINGDISVTIVCVGPNDVRLGIVAPDEVPVVREELAQKGCQQPIRKLEAGTGDRSQTRIGS
jgi:carbon storage regulator